MCGKTRWYHTTVDEFDMATTEKSRRRQVRYESLDEVLADVEALAEAETETTGDWTFPQILKHLAISMDFARETHVVTFPFYVRIVGWFMRNRWLSQGLPSGFQLPEKAADRLVPPQDTQLSEALEHFRRAIHAAKTKSIQRAHPALGVLSPDEWKTFHQRHCELHLSFVRAV